MKTNSYANVMLNNHLIASLGKFETIKADISNVSDILDKVPLWRPAHILKKQCEEALRLIDQMEKRLEKKLVVLILGPCGSGKSTLLNALAGVDNLSDIGDERPTTRELAIFCKETRDADQFIQEIGMDHIKIIKSVQADSLENVILIDTPDTDSTEQARHIPIVLKAIELSDVLICMFNAENPKRKDYVDFLEPYVARFRGESLVCVLNRCDRLDENELKESILPEFNAYLTNAWSKKISNVFCISAKRHLNDPNWDPKALPRHDFDQFQDLKQLIFGKFTADGFAVDRRLDNAMMLKEYVFSEIRKQVEKDKANLTSALEMMVVAEKSALQSSLSALKTDFPKQNIGINVLLYQKLAQKWLGPVGWMIAIWARILIFGIGMLSILRFGNPVRQILGIASSILHFKESKAAVAETENSDRMITALREFRLSITRSWPNIAELLVKSRFIPSIRQSEEIYPDPNLISQELTSLWNDAIDHAIEESSQNLSGIMLQMLLNLPAIAVIGYVGWITASNFFAGIYLTSSFFLHALLTIGIVLFLSFFLFQGIVRLAANQDRIMTKAFLSIQQWVEQIQPKPLNPLLKQGETILNLKNMFF